MQTSKFTLLYFKRPELKLLEQHSQFPDLLAAKIHLSALIREGLLCIDCKIPKYLHMRTVNYFLSL